MKHSELKPNFNVNATRVYLNGCTGLKRISGKDVNTTEQARPYLNKIADAVQNAPESLDMKVVHNDCGTAHCIAGWAQVLFPNQVREGFELVDAITLLGQDAHSVFYESNEEGYAFLKQFAGAKQ